MLHHIIYQIKYAHTWEISVFITDSILSPVLNMESMQKIPTLEFL